MLLRSSRECSLIATRQPYLDPCKKGTLLRFSPAQSVYVVAFEELLRPSLLVAAEINERVEARVSEVSLCKVIQGESPRCPLH